MPLIDPTTNLGKVRLRCGDFSDVPFLPDSVYEATLADTNNNVVRAAGICAIYSSLSNKEYKVKTSKH